MISPYFRSGTRLIIQLLLLNFAFFLGTNLSSAQEKSFSQTDKTKTHPNYTTVIAGEHYKRSSLHQWLWGKHYRKDWVTSVKVKVLNLDTVNGGLTVYQKGGGRQSKTLRLRNPAGKEYVLRSIDKSFGGALPEKYRGMFIEDIINDQVSIAEPYAAVTIPLMAEAAGIYHTNPEIVFIPVQTALGEFNEEFGNQLYLFEQRPDENWEEADNFANSKKIISTEKMLEKIFEENDHQPDQLGFVRARLFDVFIGDWGRHEDQWRWATIEDGDNKIYKPIPRDRDQVYTKFDGALLSIAISAAGAGHLETFGHDIKNVSTYNFPARNLDRQIANEPSKEQWIAIATELQQLLSDEIIENSVKQLPPEVYPFSGDEIIEKLKSRRGKLVDFATNYYLFLAKEVDIVGTHDAELFEIITISPTETQINVYDLNKENKPKKNPFYSRRFYSNETKEIRVYGLTGADQYNITTEKTNGIKIRIIGGPEKDLYSDSGMKTNRVHIYDNSDNEFSGLHHSRKHISENPFIHSYTYNGFKYDKKGISPIISFNNEDRLHIGLKYGIEKQQWRKYPFGYKQEFAARYSLSEKAFSFGYNGIFTEMIGRWNFNLKASYDFIRWNNYFGIGNETEKLTDDRDFNRVRSKEFYAGIGLDRILGHYHHTGLTAYYQTIEILNDQGRFLKETPGVTSFDPKHFAGVNLEYSYQKLDNMVVPTKGIRFESNINYMQNLKQDDSAVINYSAVINTYLPLSKSFIFYLKTGGATLSGKPEFYQLNKLSGSKTLRGFRNSRFYGNSIFYNQAELQFVRDVKTYLFTGKAGLIALFDIGRVWHPGETSDLWHYAYGGGILLAPFNKISIAVFYAYSRKENDFSVRFSKNL